MPNFNELRDYAQRMQQEQVKSRSFRAPAALKADVVRGQKMQTVVDHPGWQEYVKHVEEALRLAESARDGAIQQLLNLDSVGDAALALKLKIRELDGARGAYASVLALVPKLIDEAVKASEELERA